MRNVWRVVMAGVSLWTLIGCGTPSQPTTERNDTIQLSSADAQNAASAEADLSGIKEFLLTQTADLVGATNELKQVSTRYFELAKGADFDYGKLWNGQRDDVTATIEAARAAWIAASPLYEKMEGIVAGTPSLSEFDVVLDAGASGQEGGENVVPFDLALENGRVLQKPGNLFGVSESTLWGTEPDFVVSQVTADFNNNGRLEFGESLPDAHVLLAAADMLNEYANQLHSASQSWSPTTTDAFNALVTMIPTMNEYFSSWRDSRFIAGENSTQRDFVAISRLADIQDILSGLEVVYQNVQPLAATLDKAQSEQIAAELSALHDFVATVYAQEQSGKRFSAEDAELLGAEAQNRATAVTGQISQMAQLLGIELP